MRFSGVTFGVAPPEEWPRLRRDLLRFESHLACRQHDVGLVADFPLSIAMPPNVSFHHKPTPLPPDRRAWVNREMMKLEDAGIVERCSTTTCASNVVLVEEGQSGQDFRLCTNFTDLNARCLDEPYGMKDMQQLVDEW